MPACLQYIPCNHVIFVVSPNNFITSKMSSVLNYTSMMVNSSAIEYLRFLSWPFFECECNFASEINCEN